MATIRMQPTITCYVNEPIRVIARFLNILLEPLHKRAISSTKFITGMDAVQAFEQYTDQGRLRSTTIFVTVQIHDLLRSVQK